MGYRFPPRRTYLPVSLALLALGGLGLLGVNSFTTFLCITSVIGIVVPFAIFFLVWTSRHYLALSGAAMRSSHRPVGKRP